MRKLACFLLLLFALALAGSCAWAQAAPDPASPPAASTASDAGTVEAPRHRSRPSRPNPDANGVYHLGDGVTPPRVVYQEEASFTDKARKLRVQGTSTVSLTVDENGQPRNVHTARSVAEMLTRMQGAPPSGKIEKAARELDANAIKSVEKYRFEPAQFHGAPVAVEIDVEVSYKLY